MLARTRCLNLSIRAAVRRRALALALAAGCAAGALAHASPAQAIGKYTAYVGNYGSGTVTPVNVATHTAGNPIRVGTNPFAIAIIPDGTKAYVANFGSGTVTPIALATNTAGSPITVGANPAGIAISPDGKTAYVTDYGSGTVTPINVATNIAGSPISVGANPWGIAITPDAKTAYVANYGSGTVTPINVATNTAGSPITVGASPVAIAINPAGTTAYVLNNGSGTVTPITVATNTAGGAINIGASSPWGIAITPDGTTAYVGNYGAGTVIPITLATNTGGSPISVGGGPSGVAIIPDQSSAYVADSSGNSLVPISLAAKTPGPAIATGTTPYPIAISPDQAPVASFNVIPAPAGSPTAFNASASTVAYGTIASYAWNFGDGQTATTSIPTTTHSYANPGNYIASVTETDSAGTSTTQVFTGQTVTRNGGPRAQATRSVSVPAPPAIVPPTRVVISTTSVKVTPNGDVSVEVSCPESAFNGCSGTITIKLAAPRSRRVFAVASRCGRGCRPLGDGRFYVSRGTSRRVRIHLSRDGRRLLAHRSAVRVTITATGVSDGQRAITVRTVTLRMPARHPKRYPPRRHLLVKLF